MSDLTKAVAEPSEENAKLVEAIALPRALMGGTRAMRKAGKAYLPQEPAEDTKRWETRRDRSVLYPAFKKAVYMLVGKALGSPITQGADIPVDFKPWLENIDQQGRDLDTFARDVLKDSLRDGIGFVLVDYPRVVQAAENLAQEKALGLRPYWVHIPGDRLLGWKTETVNGSIRYSQVRILETVDVPDPKNPWASVCRAQIRVLSPRLVEVYIKDAQGTWSLDPMQSGPTTMDEVPLVPIYTGRTGFSTGEPPLEDLAWLNVLHWQSSSDQRHILHVARVPIWFAKGLGEGSVVIGPDSMVKGEGPDADLKIVEHTGAAIEAGRTDLQDVKEDMRRVSGEMLSTVNGDKSATEAALEASEGESTLKSIVRTFEDALEECLRLTAKWVGLEQGGSLTIDTQWDDLNLDAPTLIALNAVVQAGNLPLEEFLHTLKRWGYIRQDQDLQTLLQKLDDQKAKMQAMAPPVLPFQTKTKAGQMPAAGDMPGAQPPKA